MFTFSRHNGTRKCCTVYSKGRRTLYTNWVTYSRTSFVTKMSADFDRGLVFFMSALASRQHARVVLLSWTRVGDLCGSEAILWRLILSFYCAFVSLHWIGTKPLESRASLPRCLHEPLGARKPWPRGLQTERQISQASSKNILICVPKMNESRTGLERHEGAQLMTEFSSVRKLYLQV